MKITTNQREILLDSVMYSALFYILANTKMYHMTSKLFPKFKDRTIIHGFVFMVIYILIQKLTKRF